VVSDDARRGVSSRHCSALRQQRLDLAGEIEALLAQR
jgi:hypothetical protein